MRVLLVEDEPSIAKSVQQGLTEHRYAVDVAFDGQEGLAYALAAEYDVLIYVDSIELEYKPLSVKSGDLRLQSQFNYIPRWSGLILGDQSYQELKKC